jgi:hypothetical protein
MLSCTLREARWGWLNSAEAYGFQEDLESRITSMLMA